MNINNIYMEIYHPDELQDDDYYDLVEYYDNCSPYDDLTEAKKREFIEEYNKENKTGDNCESRKRL